MTGRPTSGVTPCLTIKDGRGAEACRFYAAAFGAEVAEQNFAEDGKRLMYAGLLLNGAHLILFDEFPEWQPPAPPASGVTIHLQVEDADALFERAVAAGAEVTMPLADAFWGDRYGQLRDPFGHSWSLGATIRA
ncbi:VOC family protein [Sphingomonas jatrophae]|uniref:PhnB protein n=1 Tax=Sphingomonas jatrophae TaxID=1166337 RepID=A0A1I6L358_9SPHN|nr:VOC family protein [Sphingomonas jatrophae]SFR97901.1 PhnB protein [Sphingomonas jatrophae]